MSLIEKAEEQADAKDAEEMARKLRKEEFTLDDFRKQIVQMKKMGSLSSILGHLPGTGMFKGLDKAEVDDRKIVHFEAIISAMTPEERADERVINGSRRARIARGSGRPVQEVNQLLRQFAELKKMMKKPGFKKMLGAIPSGKSR